MTEPATDSERLGVLLALLPWQQSHGLFPPEALRELMLNEKTHLHDQWSYLTNVADEFGKVLDHDMSIWHPDRVFILAMRVLDTFEPLDVDVARVIGTLLPVHTAGTVWVKDVVAHAWRIVSMVHGAQRLAQLRHRHRRST